MASTATVILKAVNQSSGVFIKVARDAQTGFTKISKSVKSVNTNVFSLGDAFTGLASRVGAAAIGFTSFQATMRGIFNIVKSTTDEFLSFERGIAKVANLGGEAGARVDEFTASIQQMHPALGTSSELIEALRQGLTKGLDPERAIEVLTTSAEAARAQFSDLGETVSLVNQVFAVAGDEWNSSRELLNGLIAVTQTGNAEFSDITKTLGNALGFTSQFGINAAEAASDIAQMAIVLGNTTKATTAYRAVLTQALKRSREFAKAGIDVNAVLGKKGGFVDLLAILKKRQDEGSGSLKDFFTNIRAFNGAAVVTGGLLDKMASAHGRVFQAIEQTGSANDVLRENFNRVTATLGGSLQTLQNSFSKLVTMVVNGSGSMTTFTKVVQLLTSHLDTNGSTVKLLQASLNSLLGSVGLLASGFMALGVAIVGTAGGITLTIGKLTSLGAKLAQLTADVIDFATASGGALSGLAEKVTKPADDFGNTVGEMGQAGLDMSKDLMSATESVFNLSLDAFVEMTNQANAAGAAMALNGERAVQAGQKIGSAAGPVGELSNGMKGVAINMDRAALSVATFAKGAADVPAHIGVAQKSSTEAAAAIQLAWETAFNTTQGQVEQLAQTSIDSFQVMAAEGSVPARVLSAEFSKEVNKAAKFLGKDSPILKEMLALETALQEKAGEISGSFVREFEILGIAIPKTIKDAVPRAIDAFDALLESGKVTGKALQDVYAKTAQFIIDRGGEIPKAWTDQFGVIVSKSKTAANAIEASFSSLGVNIKNMSDDAIRKVEENFQKAVDSGDFTADELKRIWQAVGKFIISKGGEVKDAWVRQFGEIGDAAQTTGNRVKDAFEKAGIPLKEFGREAERNIKAAFQEVLISGDFTRDQLKVIFKDVEQALIANGAEVPQAWKANFGTLVEDAKGAAGAINETFKNLSDAQIAFAKMTGRVTREELSKIPAEAQKVKAQTDSIFDTPAPTIHIPFSSDLPTLKEQLKRFTENRDLVRSDPIGVRGLRDFQFKENQKIARAIKQRIKELTIAEARLNDEFENLGKVGTKSANQISNSFGNLGLQMNSATETVRHKIRSVSTEYLQLNKSVNEVTKSVGKLSAVQSSVSENLSESGFRRTSGILDTTTPLQKKLGEPDEVPQSMKFLEPLRPKPTESLVLGSPPDTFRPSGVELRASSGAQGASNTNRTNQLLEDILAEQRSVRTSARGMTDVQSDNRTVDSRDALDNSAELNRLAARGQLQDVMGSMTQRTLNKAIIPVSRAQIRRRQLSTDTNRATGITRKGQDLIQ